MNKIEELINIQLENLNRIEELFKNDESLLNQKPLKLENTILSIIDNHKNIYKSHNETKENLLELEKRASFIEHSNRVSHKSKKEFELKENSLNESKKLATDNFSEDEKIIIENIEESNDISELEDLQSKINNSLKTKMAVILKE